MKSRRNHYARSIVLFFAAIAIVFSIRAQVRTAEGKEEPLVLRSGVPIGFLGYPVGDRLDIEGEKAGFNTSLKVTKVNGKILDKPVRVWTHGQILPDGKLNLIGYERPFMMGQAPATIPGGRPPINLHEWSLASEFVVISGLPLKKNDSEPAP